MGAVLGVASVARRRATGGRRTPCMLSLPAQLLSLAAASTGAARGEAEGGAEKSLCFAHS